MIIFNNKSNRYKVQTTMQGKVRIHAKDLQRLQNESLFHLSKLIKTGIIQIEDLGDFSFPITNIHAYIYLQYHLQKGSGLSGELIEFIDAIVTNRQSLVSSAHTNSEDAPILMEVELIEAILNLSPKAIDRYRIDEPIKAIDYKQKQGKVFVSVKDAFAMGNIQNLCIAALKSEMIHLSYFQSLAILKEVLLPIYFNVASLGNQKVILQAIKRETVVHKVNYMEEQLSKLFLSFYQNYWSTIVCSNTNIEHIDALEKQFTLLQILHQSAPYPHQLLKSHLFKLHLKALLQFSGENRGSIHLLAIKVYERTANCLGQMGNNAQVFIKLFNILSCYGSHLVKDVWGCFYGLVEGKEAAVYEKLELMDIVLGKLDKHQNSNVIKNCLHQLLKNQQSNRIFELTPTVIYSSLIRMLNLGVHYLDCMFHMDSKMYPLIATFFLRYYNTSPAPARLDQHLTWLLQSILAKDNYDHALIALLMVFPQQKHHTTFFGLDGLVKTKPLLVAAYSRYPIRKRFQLVDSLLGLISNNISLAQIKVGHLMDYFALINEDYLIDDNLLKLKNILQIYPKEVRSLWAERIAQEVVYEVKQHVSLQSQSENLGETYNKIKMIELYQRLYKVQFHEYHRYFLELIQQFGESQYKNLRQRYVAITVYSLIKRNLISRLKQARFFVPHLDAVLNSIALYSQLRLEHPSEFECKLETLQIVSHLFSRAYGSVEGEEFKEREGERVVVARMMEWASDRLDTDPLALDIIIEACRSRILVIFQRRNKPHQYCNYEHLFEESLFELYDQLEQLEVNQKFKCKCSNISRDKQLRLRTLLTTILLNDGSHRVRHCPPSCSDIGDIIDRYDFQSYEEVCWLIHTVYSSTLAENKNVIASEEEASSLVKQLELLLENMVHNLEYSLGKKEIVAISECAVQVLLSFAYNSGAFSQSLVDFCIKLINAGESYLIFQRVVALMLANQLYLNFKRLSQLNCEKLMPLIIQVLTIEEYRGFDSAVYMSQQNSSQLLYQKFGADLESNYEGATPRFLAIYAFKDILKRGLNKREMLLLQQCIWAAFEVCMSVVAKEKMFLSGRNTLKLQLWQFLLVFNPQQLPVILGQQFDKILLRCIDGLSHNLISQIRYYFQMFLMRLLTCKANFALITNQMLRELRTGLLKSIGNINRTVSYIVVSGILIRHISTEGETHPHFNTIKLDFVALYNCLLTYVGSSVAYFRGLSQFFCLQFTTGCLQTKYVSILRQNFLMDKDAQHLIQKLSTIMNGYMKEMAEWEVEREILRKTPNNNRNVVSDRYYMDILKQFSTELAKINKNLDGFTAYRYIWRKNVAKNEPVEEEEDDVPEGQEEQPAAEEGEEDIFQRKIDPTLDHIYGEECKSQLKLMVTSGKSQALIGHLARTGEIFGIQELIVPCKKIIELDQFKSISVTAERWLKISDLGSALGVRPKVQNILSALIRMKSEGFEVIKLAKWQGGSGLSKTLKLPRKCVLVLDEEECLNAECSRLVDEELQVGRHFSLHVEASIFIWSYFKQHISRA